MVRYEDIDLSGSPLVKLIKHPAAMAPYWLAKPRQLNTKLSRLVSVDM